jgi:hypothetical protein
LDTRNGGGIMDKDKIIKKLKNQIDMMWLGFEEGISVDEMNKRIFPESFKEE